MKSPATKARFLVKAALAFALIATPVVVVMAYRWLRPADEVAVTVSNVHPDTRVLCLVVETAKGPEAMGWSLRKLFPFTMHPNYSIVSEYEARKKGPYHVSWVDGGRYGVLTRDRDDRWRVFWFSPEDVHLQGRYWVIGGGEAFIELPDRDSAELASEELLSRVGFGPAVRKDWRKWDSDR